MRSAYICLNVVLALLLGTACRAAAPATQPAARLAAPADLTPEQQKLWRLEDARRDFVTQSGELLCQFTPGVEREVRAALAAKQPQSPSYGLVSQSLRLCEVLGHEIKQFSEENPGLNDTVKRTGAVDDFLLYVDAFAGYLAGKPGFTRERLQEMLTNARPFMKQS